MTIFDEVYYLFQTIPERLPEAAASSPRRRTSAASCACPRRSTTGIQVQLIDAARVCGSGADPFVANLRCSDTALIVNIDYAFGEQAEEIMRSLLLLFGRNVRSINVLGKAGSLVGARGDILLPTAFIEQANDAFQPLPGEGRQTVARLEAPFPAERSTRGPCLRWAALFCRTAVCFSSTVGYGAASGSRWRASGTCSALLESEELGVLRPGARRRFLYYVSDLPSGGGPGSVGEDEPSRGHPSFICHYA